jgi:hypothetical protein
MTDRELRGLKRSELLELMFSLRKELDKANEENESLKKQLEAIDSSHEELLRLMKKASLQLDSLCAAETVKSDESDDTADTAENETES